MSERPRFVYVMERDGRLKIGCSNDPRARARALGAQLLACKPGSWAEERRLHRWFEEHALGHEWFEDVRCIRSMANEWGLDALEVLQPASRPPVERMVYFPSEVAEILGRPLEGVYRELRDSGSVAGVPGIRIGRSWRLSMARVDAVATASRAALQEAS